MFENLQYRLKSFTRRHCIVAFRIQEDRTPGSQPTDHSQDYPFADRLRGEAHLARASVRIFHAHEWQSQPIELATLYQHKPLVRTIADMAVVFRQLLGDDDYLATSFFYDDDIHVLALTDPAGVLLYRTIEGSRQQIRSIVAGNIPLKPSIKAADEIALNHSYGAVERYEQTTIRLIRYLNRNVGLSELDLHTIYVDSLDWLADLHGLKSLDLGSDPVVSLAPLLKLQDLEVLRLRVDDTVVASSGGFKELLGLPRLRQLGLRYVNSAVIRALSVFTSLESLSLSENSLHFSERDVTSLVPIANLVSLKELAVGVAGPVSLEPLAALTELNRLELGETGIDSLEPLTHLTKLQHLKIKLRGDAFFSTFAKLRHLKTLDLSWGTIPSLEFLRSLEGLEELDCSTAGVSSLEPLRNLSKLRVLNIQSSKVSSLEPIGALTELERIDASYSPITSLEPLRGLTHLQFLDVKATRVVDYRPILHLPLEAGDGVNTGLRMEWTAVSEEDDELGIILLGIDRMVPYAKQWQRLKDVYQDPQYRNTWDTLAQRVESDAQEGVTRDDGDRLITVDTTETFQLASANALHNVLPPVPESLLTQEFASDFSRGSHGPGEERFWEGMDMYKHADKEGAVDAWLEAIERGITGDLLATTHGNLGQIYVDLGDFVSAVDSFRACLDVSPKSADTTWQAASRLSYFYEAAGRHDDAKKLTRLAEAANFELSTPVMHLTEEIIRHGELASRYANLVSEGATLPAHWNTTQ